MDILKFEKMKEVVNTILKSLPELKGVNYSDFIIDTKTNLLQLRIYIDDVDDAYFNINNIVEKK